MNLEKSPNSAKITAEDSMPIPGRESINNNNLKAEDMLNDYELNVSVYAKEYLPNDIIYEGKRGFD